MTLSGLPKNVSLSVALKKSGNTSLVLGTSVKTLPDGTLKLDIPSPMMAGLTPGKAQIEVTIGGGSAPKISSVWLYKDANLIYKGYFSTGADTPRWVGIGNQVTYAINEYTPVSTAYRKLEAYTYITTTPFLKSKPQFTNQTSMRNDAAAAITDSTIVLAFSDPVVPKTNIIACPLNANDCNNVATGVANTYDRIRAVAADRGSSLYAVAPETPTDKLDIYAIASNLPTSKSVSPDQPPVSGVAIKTIGVGQFNGSDTLSDLLIWQFSGQSQTATVYLQQASGGLKRDQGASMSLQALLGTADVDALTVADLDMDGLDDIIVARGNAITTYINQADSSWKISGSIPVPTDISSSDKVTGIAVGQLDADSFPDLVVSSAIGKRIGVYINNNQ
jgi:hypothetical protein